MKIRIQAKGLNPVEVFEDIRSVVVYDDHGNPMYVGQQLDSDTCIHEKAGKPDFDKLLKDLGIGLNKEYKVIKRS